MKLILGITFMSLYFGAFTQIGCWGLGDETDGAYHATANTTLAGGTYNFTSFTIDPGVTVNITGTNPLIIYSSESVTIDGVLSANGGNGSDGVTFASAGIGGAGVAGGANGGDGTFSPTLSGMQGADGTYTGAGTGGLNWSGGGGAGYATTGSSSGGATGGFGGPSYGTTDLVDLFPGSGGGGGSGGNNCGSGGGGAGGGVIVINSDSISIGAGGIISVNGGNGGSDGTGSCGGGGGGSGGALWIASSYLSNDGLILAEGGLGGASNTSGSPYFGTGGNGSDGRIRIDFNTLVGGGVISPIAETSIPIPFFSQVLTLCSGDSVEVGNEAYNSTGLYRDTLAGVNGCDSIVSTDLTVLAPIGSTQTFTICNGDSIVFNNNSYNSSGLYLDTLAAASGCDSIVSTDLTVEAPIGSTQTFTICNGDSIVFNNNSYNSSGLYLDTLAAANGCDSIISTDLTVEAPLDLNVSNNSGVLSSDEVGASYAWVDCDNGSTVVSGETNQTFTPSVNGNYAVIITVGSCSDTSDCVLYDMVGIKENNALNYKLYPNPSTDKLTLEVPNSSNPYLVTIYNPQGQMVYSSEKTESKVVLNIDRLKKGVYYLHVSNTSINEKLIFVRN